MSSWSKTSWQSYLVLQQPNWPDQDEFNSVIENISSLPPLVFAGKIRVLKQQLAKAAQGEAFVLQGGDCAEEFAMCNAPAIRELLKVILQMAVIISYAGGKPVIKLGRIAGQFGAYRERRGRADRQQQDDPDGLAGTRLHAPGRARDHRAPPAVGALSGKEPQPRGGPARTACLGVRGI